MKKKKFVYITRAEWNDGSYAYANAFNVRVAEEQRTYYKHSDAADVTTIKLPVALWSRGPDHESVNDLSVSGKVFW